MAFGTTNYPVFVEFNCPDDGVTASIALSQITAVQSIYNETKNRTIVSTSDGECFRVEGTYSEVMQKINAKIPKPAKWPPTEGSKKDDHLPPRKENIQPQPVTTTGQSDPRQVSEHLSYDRSPASVLGRILGPDLPRY